MEMMVQIRKMKILNGNPQIEKERLLGMETSPVEEFDCVGCDETLWTPFMGQA